MPPNNATRYEDLHSAMYSAYRLLVKAAEIKGQTSYAAMLEVAVARSPSVLAEAQAQKHLLIKPKPKVIPSAETSIADLFEKENAVNTVATLELYRDEVPQAGYLADNMYEVDSALKQRREDTSAGIGALGRDELKRRIGNFRGRFRLDFTDDYLNGLSVDRLRHILLAALINNKSDR